MLLDFFSLTLNYKKRLERPATDKHSSSFCFGINEIENLQPPNFKRLFITLLANIGIGTNGLAYFGYLSVIKKTFQAVYYWLVNGRIS